MKINKIFKSNEKTLRESISCDAISALGKQKITFPENTMVQIRKMRSFSKYRSQETSEAYKHCKETLTNIKKLIR